MSKKMIIPVELYIRDLYRVYVECDENTTNDQAAALARQMALCGDVDHTMLAADQEIEYDDVQIAFVDDEAAWTEEEEQEMKGDSDMQLHHTFPAYPLKVEFTPGTWGENDWKLGEIACVSRAYYAFPDGTEYAVFKFCERTHTGRKRLRWEAWHNGKFSNNYFNGFDEAVSWAENLVRFNGWPGKLNDYRVYPQ